jgi:hypothetical protein
MMDQRCAPSLFLHFEQVPSFVRAQLEESRSFRKKHDWRQAAGRALRAREYCKEANTPVGVAVAQIHLADCYREVGELGRSLEQCEEDTTRLWQSISWGYCMSFSFLATTCAS